MKQLIKLIKNQQKLSTTKVRNSENKIAQIAMRNFFEGDIELVESRIDGAVVKVDIQLKGDKTNTIYFNKNKNITYCNKIKDVNVADYVNDIDKAELAHCWNTLIESTEMIVKCDIDLVRISNY